MKKKYKTVPNLFFIEFIIALFFFLIISTVCIRVFVHAHLVTRGAEALSFAQTVSSSVAETIEKDCGKGASLLQVFPQMQENSEGAYSLTYGQDFQPCEPKEAFYTLTLQLSREKQLACARISVTDNKQNQIYELEVQFHPPLTRKEAIS